MHYSRRLSLLSTVFPFSLNRSNIAATFYLSTKFKARLLFLLYAPNSLGTVRANWKRKYWKQLCSKVRSHLFFLFFFHLFLSSCSKRIHSTWSSKAFSTWVHIWKFSDDQHKGVSCLLLGTRGVTDRYILNLSNKLWKVHPVTLLALLPVWAT